MPYKTAKFFHISGLILWLGPSTGGYILFLLARYQGQHDIALWVLREYLKLVDFEALGLATLIASGLTMRSLGPGLRLARWLKRKLRIVFLVFVPLEAIHLFIYHVIVKKAFLTGQSITEAVVLYDKFSIISFFILVVAVPVVFRLAIFRPEPAGEE
ncbi:MAG: hypothetical protein HY893_06095 [Deltaproteobacteria bacterium]|nr:hypothetical protein [Deltaproteobacteria bacterium]